MFKVESKIKFSNNYDFNILLYLFCYICLILIEEFKLDLKDIDYYDIIFKNTIDPILFLKDGKFIDCNKATLDILKIKVKRTF